MCDKDTGDFAKKGQSKVHPKLNAAKMFADGWWCNYCFCGGRVIGDVGDPFVASEGKELCEHATCQLTDVGGSGPDNPYCSDAAAILCFSGQCSFPKVEGSPTCVICNKPVAGEWGGDWKMQLFDYTMKSDHQFWLYYLLCMGEALNAPGGSGKPMLAMERKMLCLKEGLQCVKVSEDSEDGGSVFCASLGTFLCFWDQCQFPPKKDNPKFACCEVIRLNKENKGSSVAPMSYGKSA
jgi:hypothetical protein